MNQKKLEMAFKRYSKNFVDGIKFEDVKDKYNVSKNKIEKIVEQNEIEKGHILLINLSKIFSYHLSLWKNDVLINDGNNVEGLKNMQKVLFYQCMGQDLYTIRYPKMILGYTFREVTLTIVHFAMYGWEKEENILYDFMVHHFCGHLIDANEENRHIWFLLELYLQYKNKTIMGTNQKLHLIVKNKFKEAKLRCDLIPEDLNMYDEVLGRWATDDLEEIEHLISIMAHYHSALVSEIGQLGEFGDFRYGFYPVEILFLIHVRKQLGLPVPTQIDNFLMNTPEARMVFGEREPYPKWDPVLQMIDQFYRKNYPEYIPNKHGELF
ncbi:hypothetical protein COD82_26805 [Bacillus cereus]|uniref:hypothetical protein n=1 Tax=Bacillus TaxID=1386 RepID=UPI0001A0F52E|nr:MULTISPECIES: hypothetical protein [Bacillus]EEL55242.1 hypothetical protein bcere0023_31190 [Bacillus cereus Rock4-2]KAF6699378.1 hypothetical protein HFD78_13040 [Bacillus sp. EKM501B]MDA2391669.1 hypothetical protein [Bacillus cereus]MEB9543600.1 hypothetical protein [Bacillus cereus]MEB9833945.1 hypothetical protein [Bacillus cereus]